MALGSTRLLFSQLQSLGTHSSTLGWGHHARPGTATPQGRSPDPERAQPKSLRSSCLFPSHKKHWEPQEPQKCLLSTAQSLSL